MTDILCTYCPSNSYYSSFYNKCVDLNIEVKCLDKFGNGSSLNSGKCLSCPDHYCLIEDEGICIEYTKFNIQLYECMMPL